MTDLEKLRAACIRANPDIEEWQYEEDVGGSMGGKKVARPIRLADVLLVTEEQWRTMYGVSPVDGRKRDVPLSEGQMLYHIASKWSLRIDNLSQQSPETLHFLAQLLD